MTLGRAREVRRLLAAGTPPEGWPVVNALGHPRRGEPVEKCSLVNCPEPGIYAVRFVRLDVEFNGATTAACQLHLDHFAASGADWVRA